MIAELYDIFCHEKMKKRKPKNFSFDLIISFFFISDSDFTFRKSFKTSLTWTSLGKTWMLIVSKINCQYSEVNNIGFTFDWNNFERKCCKKIFAIEKHSNEISFFNIFWNTNVDIRGYHRMTGNLNWNITKIRFLKNVLKAIERIWDQ